VKQLAITILFITVSSSLHAAVQNKVIEYKQGDQVLEGYLAWDDATTAPRPGVLVVHEWTGLGDYVKMRADKLAALGYVAFAADRRSWAAMLAFFDEVSKENLKGVHDGVQ